MKDNSLTIKDDKKNPYSEHPKVIISFLEKIHPFSSLPNKAIKEISRFVIIDFFPRGTIIFKQDETEVSSLYIIQKGGVKLYLKNEDGDISLKDYRGEGSYIGALPIIQGSKANLTVETVEDTFCFLIPKEKFLELLEEYPKVAQFFLKSFSQKLLRTAYQELRKNKITSRSESSLLLFSVQLNDLIKRQPETIMASDTIQKAAQKMAQGHIGSLLVTGRNDEIIGIVTDKDLRNKVVARGLSYLEPVDKIMSSPVKTLSHRTVAFDALLQMMQQQVHHLAIEKDNSIIGVVTAHDIMVLQGSSPLYIFREIVSKQRVEDLYSISQKVPSIIRNLLEEGARANNITRVIAILNDLILERLLTLLQDDMGIAPVKFSWLLMGSEGRQEQTFRTDQDNAILYEYVDDKGLMDEAQLYFREFGKKAIEHLVRCGFPPCPGNIMASNEKWCKHYRVWEGYFDEWIMRPEPEEIRNATIFFDFRSGYGDSLLTRNLRAHLLEKSSKHSIFQLHLARDCLEIRPPLSFFRNFIVEKDGEHKNHLDIKKRGIVPFVDFARLMSLKAKIKETNTFMRLQAIRDMGEMSNELYLEAREAYEFLMHLRLVHQLRLLDEGKEPDNFINPGDLTDIEKKTLKEAFSVIGRLQSLIKEIYAICL